MGISARVMNIAFTGDKEVMAQTLFNAEPRPHKRLVQNYVDYIKENRQDINDYVMGLFREYDHVILCERMHPEMTQYDMIYNLATDDRFVDSVGVVFTEIGNVESKIYRANIDSHRLISFYFGDDSSRKGEADRWAKFTERNIGRIVVCELNDTIVMAPKVNSEITSGICAVSGMHLSNIYINNLFLVPVEPDEIEIIEIE